MVIKRVGPMSAAKIYGFFGVAIGLLIGGLISIVSLVAGGIMATDEGGMGGMLFGVGAVIIAPIFYGACSFVGGALAAAIYNVVAGFVGGLEIETQ